MKLPLLITKFIDRIDQDLIFMRASSLTYQTFLAIVPLLAVMFGIAKGFGIDTALENLLRAELSEHQEILGYFLSFSQTTLQEARGGVVAGAGIAVLFFTAMRLFSSVESTFNIMWGIGKPRRYVHRAISYLALIVVCPLLLVIAGSVTIFLSTHLSLLTEKVLASHFTEIVMFGSSLIPIGTLVVLFSSLFYIIPSAQVSFRSALFSGIVAACLFQMLQMWYIQLQLSLTKISAIYGSFVALPLFLAWLWMSWCLFLFSGELSVIFEERLWRFSRDTANIDPKVCDMAILSLILTRYQNSNPITLRELSTELHIPLRSLYGALEDLKERRLIHESVDNASSSITFLPGVKAFSCTISDLIFDPSHDTVSDLRESSPEIVSAYERLSEIRDQLHIEPKNLIVPRENI